MVINCLLGLYAVIWIPYIEKSELPFDKHSPRLVYVGAICGFIAFFS